MTDKNKQRAERPSGLKVVRGGFEGKRADAPDDLTESQKQIWRNFINSEPPSFFSSSANRELLKYAVCHADSINTLTARINEFEKTPGWLKKQSGLTRYEQMLRLRSAETRAYTTVVTRLRLTNQSRYTPNHAATVGKRSAKDRPWEDDD